LKRSGIATYFWSNFQDEPTAQVILAAENLGSQLLLGPGTHCVPPPGFDFNGAVQGFFDRNVKGLPARGAAPRVTWWLAEEGGKGSWNEAARWPGVTLPRQTWYLAAEALQLRPARATKARFKVDYSVASNDTFAFWVDSQHGHGASFTSQPLPTAQQLVGFPVLHLQVAADRPEPLLFGYLELLSPAGEARVLSFGRLGAAYRKTGVAPYFVAGLPWHTGLAADYAPLTPGRGVAMAFALTPASQVIPPGYRLRLVVTGADPRQRNLNQIRLDPPPTIQLSLGGRDGSRLELPLRPLDGGA
jgi:predicted acyl esterase